MLLQVNIPLQSLNTFGINAFAKYFVEINTIESAQEFFAEKKFDTEKKLILGGGSNILFTKDYDGIVIKNNIIGIEKIQEDESHVLLKANAGSTWHQLVLHAVANNWGGVENLSLIPGLCGAAPMQNIGAYGVELKDVFESLEALNIETNQIQTFTHADCEFGYRESVFKNKLKNQFLILSITLKLNKKPIYNTSYGAIQTTLEYMGIIEPTVKSISDAVIQIRSSKLPNPAELGNAGSFFKNPEIPIGQYEKLQLQYPLLPNYKGSIPNHLKVPAGWLIEQCGWKGKVVGNTGSHKFQALVLVNYGNATGAEIYKLAQDIIASVKDKFDIVLKAEVNLE
ncbi:MAG: UDP-N-acetylmuramate dehydrogenase [Bacteroidota bacterium]|nr:UDP-N-acetylmuramate dehydrogenase [Bacteroidota bacterium]